MAAVVVPTSLHSASHAFPHHRNDFTTFHQHPHHRGPAVSHRNPFEAFAPHHHSGPNSRSASASWRHSESVVRAPVLARTPSPKYRRSGPSHSRTPSTSSETSNTSWRSQIHCPTPKPDGRHTSFLCCDLPFTLVNSFFESPPEGFLSVRLFYRGAAATLSFAFRRHQQGISVYCR